MVVGKYLAFAPESFQVLSGIDALNTAGVWPKTPTPPTNSDSVMFLEIFPKIYTDKFCRTILSKSPYSLKFSPNNHENVCVIVKTIKEQSNKIQLALEKAGAKGKIFVISAQEIKKEIIEQCGIIVVSTSVFDKVEKSLKSQIAKVPGKTIHRLKTSQKHAHYQRKFWNFLRNSSMFSNESGGKLVIKIASTEMTSEQIKENCLLLLKDTRIGEKIRGGWQAIGKVALRVGESLSAPIFEDFSLPIQTIDREEAELKRKLQEIHEKDEPAGKKQKFEGKDPKKKGDSPKAKLVFTNGTSRKGSDAGSPKRKKESHVDEDTEESSDELMKKLMNHAKQMVLAPNQPSDKISKKNKEKRIKCSAKDLVPVQKDGELSSEFKQKLIESLQGFVRGTELEDILIDPNENQIDREEAEQGEKMEEESEDNDTEDTADSTVNKKKKKKKNKEALSPIKEGFVNPLANGGSPQAKKNESAQSPKKGNLVTPLANGGSPQTNKNKLSPKKGNLVTPLAEGGSPQAKKNENAQSPKKGNLVTPLANGGSPQVTSGNNTPNKKKRRNRKSKSPRNKNANQGSPQVTKTVSFASPGEKLKKKKNKNKQNKSPLLAKVGAV